MLEMLMASIVGVGTLFEKVLKIHSIFISHFSKSIFNPLDTGRELNISCTFNLLTDCVKSVYVRSYSGPHFPTFGLNTERYGVSV